MRDEPREPTPLTPEAVAAMAALPDVAQVVTARQSFGFAYRGDRSTDAPIVAGPCDLPPLRSRLVAGRLPADSGAPEAAVSELTLYDLGVRDEAGFAAVVGTPLKV